MADKSKLGTFHMSDNLSQYEQARTGFFSFIIGDQSDVSRKPLPLVRGDFDSETGEPSDSDILLNYQEVIELSVQKSSVPNFSVAPLEVRRGNSVVKFAGIPTFSAGTLVCNDFVGLKTKEVLYALKALTYDVNNDKGGRASDWLDEDGVWHKGYKFPAILVEYTQDYQAIRSWDLIGCFVLDIKEADFDKSSDSGRTIEVSISYDRAVLKQGI